MPSIRSHVWMLVGLLLGLALGLAAAATQSPVLLDLAERWLQPFGALFVNLLSMVVIPLVTTALFAGIAGLGDLRRLGRLGARTLGFFWLTTIAAIVIGFLVAALFLPLAPVSASQQAALRATAHADSSFVRTAAQIPTGVRFLVGLVPPNPLRAMVEGNLLPVIVFTTILAVAAAALPDPKRRVLTDLADALTQALISIVHWVLIFAPLGILALVAGAVAQFGWSLIQAMAVFVVAVLVGLALFIGVVYLPAVRFIGGLSVGRFLRASRASMLMGFSTTSSLASLPVMLDAAESELAISRTVAGFVLPIGATINRAGSALFQVVALVFTARLYGIVWGAGELWLAGIAAFLASLTVAAVPAAAIVSLVPAFASTGLPLAGLTLLLGIDRVPDMARTMTNVVGHLAAASAVEGLERRGDRA